MYFYGSGIPLDLDQAIPLFEAASRQGHAKAVFLLMEMYEHMPGRENKPAALEWLQRAAELGRCDAQILLGAKYYEGENVEQDFNQAAAWFQCAADQGKPHALCNLALMYEKGEGVPQDLRRSYELLLPESYKKFLCQFNGGFISLAGSSTDLNWNEPDAAWNSNYLFSLDELQKEFRNQKMNWEVDLKWEGKWQYIPFAHTNGQELMVFSPCDQITRESAVLDASHEVWPREWGQLYDNFSHLLEDYIRRAGKLDTIVEA